MQITIDLPDNLPLTESDLRREVAIALFQQKILLIEQAAQVIYQYVTVAVKTALRYFR